MTGFASTWAVIGGCFGLWVLARTTKRGVPTLPDLGYRDEPISLLPARSIWRRRECP